MKPKEILAKIEELKKRSDYQGSTNIIYALANTLPDKSLLEFVMDNDFNEFYMRIIERRGLETRMKTKLKRRIGDNIKSLENPNYNGRTKLRGFLQSCYQYAYPKDRTKILHCMLGQPTKKDREWAYVKLKKDWDSSFYDLVDKNLGLFHEKECATVIMKHFPKDYIYQHRQELAELIGKQWVMAEIGEIHPEELNLNDLDPYERVRTIATLHLKEYRDMLESMLYTAIKHEIELILSACRLDSPNRIVDSRKYYSYVFTIDNKNYDLYWAGWEKCHDGFIPYLLQVESPYGDNHLHEAVISLRTLKCTGICLWAMGQMGMADAIIRFSEMDAKFETQFKYDKDTDNLPGKLKNWLFEVYNHISREVLKEEPSKELMSLPEIFPPTVIYDPEDLIPESSKDAVDMMSEAGFKIVDVRPGHTDIGAPYRFNNKEEKWKKNTKEN